MIPFNRGDKWRNDIILLQLSNDWSWPKIMKMRDSFKTVLESKFWKDSVRLRPNLLEICRKLCKLSWKIKNQNHGIYAKNISKIQWCDRRDHGDPLYGPNLVMALMRYCCCCNIIGNRWYHLIRVTNDEMTLYFCNYQMTEVDQK